MPKAICVVVVIVVINDCAVSRAFMQTLAPKILIAKYFCDKQIK